MEFKMPERPSVSHKGTFGRVLNISGSDYMSGAAVLSSIAALRVGCGYVILASADKVINAVAAQTQNVVFCPIEDVPKQLSCANVLLIGCGLSMSTYAIDIFKSVISLVNDIPTIIDADGLNILSKLNLDKLPPNLILTPHPAEAARLMNVSTEDILSDTTYWAQEISKKYSCVTVLKSNRTIVCSKDLNIYENNTGNSALAKAGSGDVLSGMISGLLAQKCNSFYAAKLGVYLHGLTADIAKEDLSEYGVLGSDLLRYIPYAIKTLL